MVPIDDVRIVPPSPEDFRHRKVFWTVIICTVSNFILELVRSIF